MRNTSFVFFVLLLVAFNSFLFAKDKLWFGIPDENCSNDIMYAFKWQSNPLNISKVTGWNAVLSFSPLGFSIRELNSFSLGVATNTTPFLKMGFGVDNLGSSLFSESNVYLGIQKQVFSWFSVAIRLKTAVLKIEHFGTKAFFNSDVFVQYEGFEDFLIGFKFVNSLARDQIVSQRRTAGFGFRYRPNANVSTGLDVDYILGYSTSYSVDFGAKVGERVRLEVSFRTQPQALHFGISVNPMQELTFLSYIEYNNYLAFSQTLGIVFKF